MADLSAVIRILFYGDDQLSDTARRSSGALSSLGSAVTGLASPFADLANKILLIDTALTAAALVMGTKAVQASSQFGASMSTLDRFITESGVSSGQYRAQFEQLSVQYAIGINDIVASTADWKAANYDMRASLDLTRIAMDYATAGQVEAGYATETLKKILSGMAVEQDKAASSATRFGDVINFISDKSTSGFREIADGVAAIAPSIKASGGSFEQMTGVVSVLADTLQSGSRAGEGIRVMMGQLKDPADTAKTALADFGITIDKNGISQASFYETLQKVAAKWPSLTDAQKANYAQMLVSAEQATNFSSIMDNWGKVTERATLAVSDATGSMANEVGRALLTSEKAFASFSKSIDLLMITLGEDIEPGTVKIVGALKGLALELNSIAQRPNSPFKPLADGIDTFAASAERLIGNITANLDDALARVDFSDFISAFRDLFGELGNLFSAFAGDIDLNTVDGLAAGLQKIVDTGEFLVRTTTGMVQAFRPFADAAGEAIEQFTRLDSASQVDFGQFLGSAKLIVDAGAGIGGALIAIGQASLELGPIFDFVFGGVKALINGLQIAFDGWALVVIGTAKNLAEAVRTVFDKLGQDEQVASIDRALSGLNRMFDETTAAIERNKTEMGAGLGQAMGDASAKADQLRGRLDAQAESLKGLAAGAKSAADGTDALSASGGKAAAELQKMAEIRIAVLESAPQAGRTAEEFQRLHDAATQLVPKLVNVRDANGQIIQTYTEMVPKAQSMGGTLSVVSNAYSDHAQKVEDAKKKSDDFLLKMEEIASNERIKTIEFGVNLQIEKAKADAERVKSIFESINVSIQSTGDVLSGLFGNLSGAGTYDRLEILEQIDTENKLRRETFELQKKVAEVEMDRDRAQTRALNRGDALIQVDGTGLAPELEAFMFAVFRAIRTRGNAALVDYLAALP